MTPGPCYQYAPTGQGLYALLRHLPSGMWWDAYRIADKNLNKLWRAFGAAYDDMSAALCGLVKELSPFTTENMITEWERAVGLPDPCLPIAATLEERRALVIFRLAKKRWVTARDWMDLAALFGYTISITPGWYVQEPQLFNYEFPLGFDRFPKLGRFRVYIDIENVDFAGFEFGAPGVNQNAGFPIPFGDTDPNVNALMCLIQRVKPANVVVIWNAFPTVGYQWCTRPAFSDDFDDSFC